MRLIDADTKLTVLMHDEEWFTEEMTVDDLISRFADETPPTIDAVSVIRCKDCRYFIDSNEQCQLIDTRLHFYERDKRWTEDSFCSWAERKKDKDGN